MTTATVDAKDFAAAVGWAARAVPHRSTTPILNAIPITVHDGKLTVTGFDFETTARACCAASGELPTTYVLGSMISKIASQLTGDVHLSLDGTRMLVRAGRDKYRPPVMPSEQYPTVPDLPPAIGDSPGFLDAINRVAASAAPITETGRPVLRCVAIEGHDSTLTVRATDSYRMSIATIPWSGPDFTVALPGRTLTEFGKAIGAERTTLLMSDSHFGITTSSGLTVSTLLTAAEYPSAAFRIIQAARDKAYSDEGGVLVAPRGELLGAVKRAAITLGPNDPLALRLTADGLCSTYAVGEDGDAEVTIPGNYIGPDLVVYVTAAYLAGVVDTLSTPYVSLGTFTGERAQIHVAGARDDSGDPDDAVQHIVMARKAPSAMMAAA